MPIQTAGSSPDGICVPAMTKGMLNSGRATSAAVPSADCTASAVPACVPSKPAARSMFACSAVPVAPPPGVMRLKALPASSVVMTENQSCVPSAIACTHQMHA